MTGSGNEKSSSKSSSSTGTKSGTFGGGALTAGCLTDPGETPHPPFEGTGEEGGGPFSSLGGGADRAGCFVGTGPEVESCIGVALKGGRVGGGAPFVEGEAGF